MPKFEAIVFIRQLRSDNISNRGIRGNVEKFTVWKLLPSSDKLRNIGCDESDEKFVNFVFVKSKLLSEASSGRIWSWMFSWEPHFNPNIFNT